MTSVRELPEISERVIVSDLPVPPDAAALVALAGNGGIGSIDVIVDDARVGNRNVSGRAAEIDAATKTAEGDGLHVIAAEQGIGDGYGDRVVRVFGQFSPILRPAPFELDVVATSGVAMLLRNFELVMVSDWPEYWVKNPKPAPPRALLFWMMTVVEYQAVPRWRRLRRYRPRVAARW